MKKTKITIYNIVLLISISLMLGFFIGYNMSDTSHIKLKDDSITKDLIDIQLQLDDIKYKLDMIENTNKA